MASAKEGEEERATAEGEAETKGNKEGGTVKCEESTVKQRKSGPQQNGGHSGCYLRVASFGLPQD